MTTAATIAATYFTVTGAAGGRIRVGWSDTEADYWFLASVDGDTITKIHDAGVRRSPTIYRRLKQSSGRGLSYHNAHETEFLDLIGAIKGKISREKLATKAFEAASAERRQREAERTVAKSDVVRRLMAEHGLGVVPDDIDPVSVAEFYDAIQNSAI